ncbi:AI-2E family transporter [Candidatus Vondammii sp. HM_W22]|uniref:AI-2E family transporter n=1 Tax=Candidatus Vondammii sp. HM_W22 TaxID=2687299 RepID=UPI001F12CCF2|nr:AI-2E family transporter [Candidatus Vondammii sp. HM_W22]
MEDIVAIIERRHIPRLPTVLIVFVAFLLFTVVLLFVFLQQLSRQITQLFQQVPSMITKGHALLMRLPERYPKIISVEQVQEIIAILR